MNMKKMFSVFVFVLLATVVLVNVLGNKDDGEEMLYNGKSYRDYLTELKQVNAPLELLKKYDSAQNTMEVKDPDGNALGTYQTSYTRTEEGKSCASAHPATLRCSGFGRLTDHRG